MRKNAFSAPRLVSAVAVIASLVLALLATSASANSPSATIAFTGNATLLSNPGPVSFTLKYSCLPLSPGNIIVSLSEDGLFSSDFILGAATCDGKNHSITVTLEGIFTPGVGAGTAMIENADGTASATTNATVPIK